MKKNLKGEDYGTRLPDEDIKKTNKRLLYDITDSHEAEAI